MTIIAPSEIQSELKRIWDGLEGSNKIRASLFNLVFFTKKNERTEYIHAISQNVIKKFPSRVIFITEDQEAKEDYLNTHVSVESTGEGGHDIACDFIQIDVAGTMKERIPFVILPHLLPDLPIYVIWAEDPKDTSPLFEMLTKLAHRMIFDSEAISSLPEFSKHLLDFSKIPGLDVADLNWARMESWRELVTSTFYTEERLEKLKKAKKIQIFYDAKKSEVYCHAQIQATYLANWIATQLGWELQTIKVDGGNIAFSYKNVEITLHPEEHENLKPGMIISLDIETEDEDHFSFGRNLDLPHHVSMRFSTLEKCDMPLIYILSKDESGGSLVKEICHKGTSQHFLNLLENINKHKEFSFCEY